MICANCKNDNLDTLFDEGTQYIAHFVHTECVRRTMRMIQYSAHIVIGKEIKKRCTADIVIPQTGNLVQCLSLLKLMQY